MKRRESSLLPAFALLLLCLGSVLAWGRSYLPPHLSIRSEQGRVVFVFWQSADANQALFDRETGAGPVTQALWQRLILPGSRVGPRYESLGFGTVGGEIYPFKLRLISIPWWSLTLLSVLAFIALAVRALRQRRRVRAGSCVNCGYDLRATPAKCPECGDTPEPEPTNASAFDAGEPVRPPLGITVGTDEQILGILSGGGLRARTRR